MTFQFRLLVDSSEPEELVHQFVTYALNELCATLQRNLPDAYIQYAVNTELPSVPHQKSP